MDEKPQIRQIFMDIYDVIPTEGKYVEPCSYEECADKEGFGLIPGVGIFEYTGWLEDIRQKGAIYSIRCHPDGHIADGNFRYWCYRHLWEETGDYKWRYIPVDIWFFNGNFHHDVGVFTVRRSLIGKATEDREKYPVIPAEKELVDYPDETLGHGSHGKCGIPDLKLVML